MAAGDDGRCGRVSGTAPGSPNWSATQQRAGTPSPPTRMGYDAAAHPCVEDAMRFTRGNPAHGPVYVLADALDYLARFDIA